uniref:EFG_C domain-containing protein n=1 Tax=Caenorhabditis tropicalis TaxID=1561998 RepID=A0A1I7V4E7_9PELO
MVLTEPVMSIQIDVRSDEPTQPILNELTRRRAQFEHSDAHSSTEYRRISATLPLSETENLSKTVRTLTSGFGDISVQFSGYQHVPDHEELDSAEEDGQILIFFPRIFQLYSLVYSCC